MIGREESSTLSNWTTGLDKVIHIFGAVCAALILTIMILTTVDVIGRYIIGSPLKGSVEISEILFLSAVYLGLSYTHLFREHVGVDLLISHFSKRTRLFLETFMLLLALLTYGVLAWRGGGALWSSIETGEYRWGLISIPLWPARLMIPLGVSALCLKFIAEIVRNISKLLGEKK
jgi:TRAP-type mannitol/chloroaromatic compound transport system permease small subunit